MPRLSDARRPVSNTISCRSRSVFPVAVPGTQYPVPGTRRPVPDWTLHYAVSVSLTNLFASNPLVRWLRGDPGRYDLLTRMIGARLGDRMVACGAGDPGLVAALAKVTGLSGRAVACARSAEEAAVLSSTAEAAGVLVEVTEYGSARLPFEEGDFDLALVDAVSAPVADLLPELKRVLRPGGRVVLVVRQKVPNAPAPAEVQALTAGHLKGARVLFDRDTYGIVEALKGQPSV